MEPSVFTKIIKGEIPSHKVYEDEHSFAFMDIHPILPGHVLVVPKIQVDQLDELDDENALYLLNTVRKLSRLLRNTYNTSRTVILVFGYDVPHAHVHLVPSDDSKTINAALANLDEIQSLEPDHEALEREAEKIRSNL